ncbi:MAG: AbrB/MazE/SpoVT family DNA-binding domain-containing protein [Syntrophomonadaceae bacterium]|nr:AbrB/MazE/SpoVT family DNA-binding domain-containing protein [Syntrophomonadaceae bacterium]MDD3889129.1 AbrB/MazE/SpoVT family DNA-binding domain-containing protein [Syntrophomonadaceae bacterium]MDD4549551.1 AbrB/MazE/SpoVT family DNA-binding domain-containing protein [Syntrophomonadaceae bacterium]
MATIASITIDDDGQIILPLELNKQLDLQNNDWLRVSIKSDHIVLIASKDELDEEVVEDLIRQGILIDIK